VSTKALILSAIRHYQAGVSPLLGVRCRFEPSCSVFAYEAIERYGAGRGGWLALRRLVRCRPGGGGGYDPVPAVDHATAGAGERDRARMSDQRVA
jgi:putative membrane protein insertion efficiency factor